MKAISRILCVLFAILLCFLIMDCIRQKEIVPNGLKYAVEGLPSIDRFSNSEYEDYSHHFSPAISAVYFHGDQQEVIDAADPRLIRLLNFLAYSEETNYSAWLQGYLEEEDINRYISSDVPRLEVVFDRSNHADGHILSITPKILICGHTCLLFVDTERASWPLDKGLYAEQYYPYFELLNEMVISGQLEDDVLYKNELENDSWLDLLTYAGFCADTQ